ncbi:MAG TPA: CofH family radical SAM protein [Candidatus Brocadiia bacterium]|nr:CofH family radical SAM protein [Candidatus Brocadiia bacterium]
MPPSIDKIIDGVMVGDRLSPDEALILLESNEVSVLGAAANRLARRQLRDQYRTYGVEAVVFYSNVCVSGCRFCSFFRPAGHHQGFVLSISELHRILRDASNHGPSHVRLQGGLHPDLKIDYFERLLAEIKEGFGLQIHAFSPPEILHIARASGISVTESLRRLHRAGLDSIPGDGADVFDAGCRGRISPHKCSADEWIEVAARAHGAGVPTSATMMFGHLETAEQRVAHLERLRRLQDGTHGIASFAPSTFVPRSTALPETPRITAFEYLRMIAVCRMYLDNVQHIEASWMTEGIDAASLALAFGADDIGCARIFGQNVRDVETSRYPDKEELMAAIVKAGCEPKLRSGLCEPVETEA